MYSQVEVVDVNSLVQCVVAEDTFEEELNKPDRRTDLVMDKGATLELDSASGMV